MATVCAVEVMSDKFNEVLETHCDADRSDVLHDRWYNSVRFLILGLRILKKLRDLLRNLAEESVRCVVTGHDKNDVRLQLLAGVNLWRL